MNKIVVRICLISMLSAGSFNNLGAAQGQDTVPVGQYSSVPLIEGKWGEGPAEFGTIQSYETEFVTYAPVSLAINSHNDIYILDIVNNRIKKYDQNGTYLKSIETPSLFTKDKKPFRFNEDDLHARPYYEGINIAFDSKDNLYYCLNKGETGMVIRYKSDNKDKIWNVSKVHTNYGLKVDGDDNVCVFNIMGYDYNILTGKRERKDKNAFNGKHIILKLVRNQNDYRILFINKRENKKTHELVYSNDDKRKVSVISPVIKGERVFIEHDWRQNGVEEKFVDEYNEKGILISSLRLPDVESLHLYDDSNKVDSSGNIFQFVDSNDTLKLIKWER